jgi:hypothetical protein
MPAPYEILAAPFTMYLAPLGTAFPLIDATPAVDWVKVGTSGDLNYGDEGVTVEHSQSIKLYRSLGNGGPRKAFIDEENLLIKLMLADVSLEQYKLALNSNAVTTVAAGGEAGYKKIGLTRGATLVHRALLLRGRRSAYGDAGVLTLDWNSQYEVPIAVQTGSPSAVWRRSDPVALALEWTALVDFNAATEAERFGRLVMQNADPVS